MLLSAVSPAGGRSIARGRHVIFLPYWARAYPPILGRTSRPAMALADLCWPITTEHLPDAAMARSSWPAAWSRYGVDLTPGPGDPSQSSA